MVPARVRSNVSKMVFHTRVFADYTTGTREPGFGNDNVAEGALPLSKYP
jgi:hypothetical protein